MSCVDLGREQKTNHTQTKFTRYQLISRIIDDLFSELCTNGTQIVDKLWQKCTMTFFDVQIMLQAVC